MDIQIHDSINYLVAEMASDYVSLYAVSTPPHSISDHFTRKSILVETYFSENPNDQWKMLTEWSQYWYGIDGSSSLDLAATEYKFGD